MCHSLKTVSNYVTYLLFMESNVLHYFCVTFSHLGCVPVAQWLEHCVSNAKVVGSIPREHTY